MEKTLPSWPWPLPEFRHDCRCPKVKCERRGRCRDCDDHHGRRGRLPRCVREKTGR